MVSVYVDDNNPPILLFFSYLIVIFTCLQAYGYFKDFFTKCSVAAIVSAVGLDIFTYYSNYHITSLQYISIGIIIVVFLFGICIATLLAFGDVAIPVILGTVLLIYGYNISSDWLINNMNCSATIATAILICVFLGFLTILYMLNYLVFDTKWGKIIINIAFVTVLTTLSLSIIFQEYFGISTDKTVDLLQIDWIQILTIFIVFIIYTFCTIRNEEIEETKVRELHYEEEVKRRQKRKEQTKMNKIIQEQQKKMQKGFKILNEETTPPSTPGDGDGED